MHGNQWVLKIAVLKYYSVSKRGTTAKSNPKQATDPISLHTKFGDNSSNTFPLNERKPCVTPDIGRRTPDIGHRTTDIGHRTSDGEKSKNNISTPQGGGHNDPDLGKVITVKELANVLKKMKNGKSPGIDGISVDFLKVFWIRLKYFITNCINFCYKKGKLSYSLRQSIITCLPKGNKDRQCLKSWRPISLLCVI